MAAAAVTSVVFNSVRPHESQHARPPCPSPTPGVHSDSHPSSRWCHPAISSSVVPFSSCPQSLPASESFPMSQLFAWGSQSAGKKSTWPKYMVNKRVWNAVLGCNLKNDRLSSVRFQGKPYNITVIQVYASNSNAEEAEVERFYEDLQDFLVLTHKKDVLFITGDWNAKVGIQEIPGVTGKFDLGVQNKAGQRLKGFCQENQLLIANTHFQQHKRKCYTWTSPDGKHEIRLIIFFTAKDGKALLLLLLLLLLSRFSCVWLCATP